MKHRAFSVDVSKQAIESAFGLPVDSIFDEFEDEPIASGSIGQVHKAKLSPVGATVTGAKENTEVAVKVAEPCLFCPFTAFEFEGTASERGRSIPKRHEAHAVDCSVHRSMLFSQRIQSS